MMMLTPGLSGSRPQDGPDALQQGRGLLQALQGKGVACARGKRNSNIKVCYQYAHSSHVTINNIGV